MSQKYDPRNRIVEIIFSTIEEKNCFLTRMKTALSGCKEIYVHEDGGKIRTSLLTRYSLDSVVNPNCADEIQCDDISHADRIAYLREKEDREKEETNETN